MEKLICLYLSLLTVSAFADPTVSNIRASQRENTKLVDILYDVSYSGGSNVSVTCEVSTNSGASYDVSAKSFSGTGYGTIVTTGTDRLITWDAGVDWNEKYSEQMKVRITAKAPRFTVNYYSYYDQNSNLVVYADGTITDNETGLMWRSRPVYFYGNGDYYYATNWIAACENSLNGDGWHLPTRTELHSLLDTNRAPTLPDGHPFETIHSGLYWTSSTTSFTNSMGVVPYAWCISLIDGCEVALPQTSSAVAWPVRSVY